MKFLADNKFPTREQIRRRFALKMRCMGNMEMFEPLTALYAEEAELIMLEYWRTPLENKVKIIKQGKDRKFGCAKCKDRVIYYPNNYCPNCGVKILWVTKRERTGVVAFDEIYLKTG